MKPTTLWLNKHPYLDRYLDLIIGAIIGAIIPDIVSIIKEAKKINDVFTNYRFWLLICIFIIVSIIFLFLQNLESRIIILMKKNKKQRKQ